MYLSKLTLRTNSRKAVRDLSSPYELHRTVMRGFPSKEEGGPGRVLFRLEALSDEIAPVVIVQSEKSPDWSKLDAEYVSAAGPKKLALSFRMGQRLRFRLLANPTVKREGKRWGLFGEEAQFQWLSRKASAAGFSVLDVGVRRHGMMRSPANARPQGASHFAVEFEGRLEVLDVEKFAAALAAGIGPSKGFGFGLISVAPG